MAPPAPPAGRVGDALPRAGAIRSMLRSAPPYTRLRRARRRRPPSSAAAQKEASQARVEAEEFSRKGYKAGRERDQALDQVRTLTTELELYAVIVPALGGPVAAGADGAAAMARRPRLQGGAARCRSEGRPGRAAEAGHPERRCLPPGRGGRPFRSGARRQRARPRGRVDARLDQPPQVGVRPNGAGGGGCCSREPRRPAGGGLGTASALRPSSRQHGAEVVLAGTADPRNGRRRRPRRRYRRRARR